MTRYYIDKDFNNKKKIINIWLQDDTGVYYAGSRRKFIQDREGQKEYTIQQPPEPDKDWNKQKGKKGWTIKVVPITSFEYLQWHRFWVRNIRDMTTPTEIFEFSGTKEECLDFIYGKD